MLSLPLIPPQQDTIRTHFRPRPDSPPPSTTTQNGTHQQPHQQRPRNVSTDTSSTEKSPLALLAADESAIQARKLAIRNFGAYWIRPPGVPKTLQAMTEEAAEAAEQEEALRQEQGLRDLQARQQAEELREQAGQGEEGGVEERDLDDDVPDAEDGEDGGMEGTEGGDVTFNEESMVEGSRFVENEAFTAGDAEGFAEGEVSVDQEDYAVLEEAELTGAARDEEALGIVHGERNLDDSIPEAGSYQHTDTEVEDSTDEEESSSLQDSFARPQSTRQGVQNLNIPAPSPALQASLQERMRGAGGGELARSPGNLDLSSSLLESSFVGSSPVMQRQEVQRQYIQGARGRRGGGRGRGALS